MILEHGPTINVPVGNNEAVAHTIEPWDQRNHTVRTRGRLDFDAVVLWELLPDGGDHIVMSHHDPEVPGHPDLVRQHSLPGEGRTQAVILAAEDPNDELVAAVGEAANRDPLVVTLGRPTIQDRMRHSPHTDALQLVAFRSPTERRIYIPTVGETAQTVFQFNK